MINYQFKFRANILMLEEILSITDIVYMSFNIEEGHIEQ